MRRILIQQIKFPRPQYKDLFVSKERAVLSWLIDWIEASILSGEIKYGDFLPLKSELAKYLNVSVGTLQNAIRQAEDMGYFESKQSVGTFVKNPKDTQKVFSKMNSKKDASCFQLKQYILKNNLTPGSKLPSVAALSHIIKTSQNTLRLALEQLRRENILEVRHNSLNKALWYYKNPIKEETMTEFSSFDVQNDTLVSIVSKKMRDYIVQNYNIGDKILPNEAFCKMFNVSIRTVNEAAKLLNEQKIILSRRGRYGTIYINNPERLNKKKNMDDRKVFSSSVSQASSVNSYRYSWEKTLDALEKYIAQNHQSGDKIPSMRELAQILGVSTNTIKRAVSVLCDEGCLIAQRGKYGGVFILEVPQKETEAYTWLALNPDVVRLENN